jgi:hypothetical protein
MVPLRFDKQLVAAQEDDPGKLVVAVRDPTCNAGEEACLLVASGSAEPTCSVGEEYCSCAAAIGPAVRDQPLHANGTAGLWSVTEGLQAAWEMFLDPTG